MLESRGPPVNAPILHRLDAKVAVHVTRLKGKATLVTGGGSGIGRAIALGFAREGAKVAVMGRRREALEALVSEMRQSRVEGKAVVSDVTRAEAVRNAVEEVEQAFGRLDVLVNNAGTLSATTVENISEEEWDRVIETNLKGPFLVSRAVLPAFRRTGGGAIVNIASILGLVAMKNRAAYCASKGGLVQLTKAMALDHAHENIRVNCICPAIVETELVKDLFDSSEAGQKAKHARMGTLPLGRFGRPEDVAELAVYLASDESAWVTGTAIPVDGGLSAY